MRFDLYAFAAVLALTAVVFAAFGVLLLRAMRGDEDEPVDGDPWR